MASGASGQRLSGMGPRPPACSPGGAGLQHTLSTSSSRVRGLHSLLFSSPSFLHFSVLLGGGSVLPWPSYCLGGRSAPVKQLHFKGPSVISFECPGAVTISLILHPQLQTHPHTHLVAKGQTAQNLTLSAPALEDVTLDELDNVRSRNMWWKKKNLLTIP